MRSCLIPDAGLSAGIGSVPTDTIWVIRRSDSVRGDFAASILVEMKGRYIRSASKEAAHETTYVPRYSLPSIMVLMFFQPMLSLSSSERIRRRGHL